MRDKHESTDLKRKEQAKVKAMIKKMHREENNSKEIDEEDGEDSS